MLVFGVPPPPDEGSPIVVVVVVVSSYFVPPPDGGPYWLLLFGARFWFPRLWGANDFCGCLCVGLGLRSPKVHLKLSERFPPARRGVFLYVCVISVPVCVCALVCALVWAVCFQVEGASMQRKTAADVMKSLSNALKKRPKGCQACVRVVIVTPAWPSPPSPSPSATKSGAGREAMEVAGLKTDVPMSLLVGGMACLGREVSCICDVCL